MTREDFWDLIESYRCAGGRVEHSAKEDHLKKEIELLFTRIEELAEEVSKQVAGSHVVFDRDIVEFVQSYKPKYDKYKIAHELAETAIGNSYYGEALRVAASIPELDDQDRKLIERWLVGSQTSADGFDLQLLAIRIRKL